VGAAEGSRTLYDNSESFGRQPSTLTVKQGITLSFTVYGVLRGIHDLFVTDWMGQQQPVSPLSLAVWFHYTSNHSMENGLAATSFYSSVIIACQVPSFSTASPMYSQLYLNQHSGISIAGWTLYLTTWLARGK